MRVDPAMTLARLTLMAALAASPAMAEDIADGYAIAVGAGGEIRVPALDYRAQWTQLGSWIGAGGEEVDGAVGAGYLHTVYTQPGVAALYRQTGQFPDGAVLVKELLTAETHTMTTGIVSHAVELEGWFVMVKDTQGRFPDNARWGDGWGWAYFGADNPVETTTEDYEAECLGCHVPAEATDWIYVYGYPVLAGPAIAE